jgi:hypothetical protein
MLGVGKMSLSAVEEHRIRDSTEFSFPFSMVVRQVAKEQQIHVT